MRNGLRVSRRNLLLRRLLGALAASFAASIILTLVGYADAGPKISDFAREFLIASLSYLPIALLIHWVIRIENTLWDIISVSFLGSVVSFVLKLVFLEGQNGIPAFVARATAEHSWEPFGDLITHGAIFVVLATILTLPCVALVILLWHFLTRR